MHSNKAIIRIVVVSVLKVLAASGLASIAGYSAVIVFAKLGVLSGATEKSKVIAVYGIVGLTVFALTLLIFMRNFRMKK